jgi:hypothetical protein
MGRLQLVEDEIARKLTEAHASGELRAAKDFGQPLSAMEGYDETPEEFRPAFKALKDAGYAPPEVALFHERAALKAERDAATDESARHALSKKLSELEQKIALRLEALRVRGSS